MNVAKNMSCLAAGRRKPLARYVSGDFASAVEYLCKEFHGGSYDMILSSETLYNIESHKNLLAAIKQVNCVVIRVHTGSPAPRTHL